MMAIENYSNSPVFTLNGAINNTVTTLTLNSVTGLPSVASGGQFRILIEAELMIVTGIAGLVLTVVRGQESTTATSHADAAVVVHILTKGGLEGLVRQSLNGTNVSARRELDFVNGNGVTWGVTDDPTNNKSIIGATVSPSVNFEATIVPTFLANWTWVNQGLGVATETDGTVTISSINSGSNGAQFHLLSRTVPATPWKATFRTRGTAIGTGASSGFGIGFRDSVSGKLSMWQVQVNSPNLVNVYEYTNPTTYGGSNPSTLNTLPNGNTSWWRLGDNGTIRTYEFSLNGIDWFSLYSPTRTNFLTANSVVFGVDPNTANCFTSLALTSFSF